ncbi:YceI family protein [Vibrio sp. S4M6]|uniref:YceI family protein n=1 Tax=Vibrio sinus TaxID=2946865 RepID=UPI00202ABEBE|nr:YceI family protein [Vibrio sinus]MCL9779981.1 YceI family protein [Vibrio sinus]
MKKLLSFIGLAAALVSTSSFSSDKYQLDPKLSSINFATIKKQYIVESATINQLAGTLDDKGTFQITVDLNSVQTGVPIRDTRLKEMFFETAKYPSVQIAGNINLTKSPKQLSVPAKVTWFGKTLPIDFPVVIVDGDDYVMASSYSPVIINAASFGIPAENLAKLSNAVGGIKISNQVPLNFVLVFKK